VLDFINEEDEDNSTTPMGVSIELIELNSVDELFDVLGRLGIPEDEVQALLEEAIANGQDIIIDSDIESRSSSFNKRNFSRRQSQHQDEQSYQAKKQKHREFNNEEDKEIDEEDEDEQILEIPLEEILGLAFQQAQNFGNNKKINHNINQQLEQRLQLQKLENQLLQQKMENQQLQHQLQYQQLLQKQRDNEWQRTENHREGLKQPLGNEPIYQPKLGISSCLTRTSTCDMCSSIAKQCMEDEVMMSGGCLASLALRGNFPDHGEWVCKSDGQAEVLTVSVNCCKI